MTNKSQQSMPPGLADDVERRVMDYVQKHPSPPHSVASAARLVSAVAAVAVLFLLVFGSQPVSSGYQNTDFVEQQLLLDNHTAIWLTPIEQVKSPEVAR